MMHAFDLDQRKHASCSHSQMLVQLGFVIIGQASVKSAMYYQS